MYFEALDIIRLLGFVWVFCTHTSSYTSDSRKWMDRNGFVVCPFWIFDRKTSSLLQKLSSQKNFAYLATLFLYLFLIGNFSQTWPYMLFAGNWQVMFHGWSSFVLVGHLWAVSMQEQVYVIYPWILKFWPVALLLSILLKFVFLIQIIIIPFT